MKVFFLFLFGLSHGGLILLSICHGNHSQDQVNQVEWTKKDDNNEEDHVGFPSCSQCLIKEQDGLQAVRWQREMNEV